MCLRYKKESSFCGGRKYVTFEPSGFYVPSYMQIINTDLHHILEDHNEVRFRYRLK
jgi:hypothetical protein